MGSYWKGKKSFCNDREENFSPSFANWVPSYFLGVLMPLKSTMISTFLQNNFLNFCSTFDVMEPAFAMLSI